MVDGESKTGGQDTDDHMVNPIDSEHPSEGFGVPVITLIPEILTNQDGREPHVLIVRIKTPQHGGNAHKLEEIGRGVYAPVFPRWSLPISHGHRTV
jgi:hypothetical protein